MFTKTLLLSALAALAAAQSTVLTFTNVPNPVTDGQAHAITFATNDTSSPVSIILRQGPSTDLKDVETLTTDARNGQYIWTPSTSLPNGNNYALQIKQGDQINYFGPFTVQGASTSSSMSASASPMPSANMTTSAPVTPAGTAASASGTGMTVPRNTTMSMATLTATSSSSRSSATGTATDDAGFQGTGTGSAGGASSTGAASSFQVGSGVALFGAIAAGIFLQ